MPEPATLVLLGIVVAAVLMLMTLVPAGSKLEAHLWSPSRSIGFLPPLPPTWRRTRRSDGIEAVVGWRAWALARTSAGEPELAVTSDAVGQALGRNPFAIVVPCHRVLAAWIE